MPEAEQGKAVEHRGPKDPKAGNGFDWALVQMEAHSSVYRTSWNPKYKWKLSISANNRDITIPFFFLWSGTPSTQAWMATTEDILAKDWALFQ